MVKKYRQIKIEGLCHKHVDRMNQKRKKCTGLQKQIIYGPKQKVHSFHCPGTKPDDLGHGLIPIAYDQNGWVEGFCKPEQKIAAVMWHPERTGAPEGD